MACSDCVFRCKIGCLSETQSCMASQRLSCSRSASSYNFLGVHKMLTDLHKPDSVCISGRPATADKGVPCRSVRQSSRLGFVYDAV